MRVYLTIAAIILLAISITVLVLFGERILRTLVRRPEGGRSTKPGTGNR